MISVNDIRLAGHCATGIRDWCVAHDIDFKRFARHGLRADELVIKGDGLAVRVVLKIFTRLLRETGERLGQKQA